MSRTPGCSRCSAGSSANLFHRCTWCSPVGPTPCYPWGALRGRGLLREVRTADLRFSPDEAREHVERVTRRRLTPDQLTRLVDRTEGWIAGIHLAALSLRGREDIDRRIREFAGSDVLVADYLIEELLAQLDPAVERYLMRTSLLDQLCAPLCGAVVGNEPVETIEGRPLLQWLHESSLFVVALDDHREWFRYHHLFRELLFHRLTTTHTQEDVEALRLRAADWLGSQGFVDAALHQFLLGRRPDLAADLIEDARQQALDDERWRALDRWVRRLDPGAVDQRPGLVLIHAWSAHQRADWSALGRHLQRAEELLDSGDGPVGQEAAYRGEIAAMRAELAYWNADGELAVTESRRALALLPADHRQGRATALVFQGGGLHLVGEREAAFEILREGSYGDYGRGIHPRAMIGLGLLAFMTGEVDYASQVGRDLLQRGSEYGLPESEGFGRYFLGLAAYLRNELDSAESEFGAIVPHASHVLSAKQSFYGRAWICIGQGRSDEALQIMDECAAFVSAFDLPLRSEVRMLRVRLAAVAGRPTDEALFARGMLPPAGQMPVPLHVCYEFSPLSAVAVLLAEGDRGYLEQCEKTLADLLASAEANGNVFRSVQCLALRALLFDRRDRRADALASLASAVALARPGKLIRLFSEMGPALAPLLQGVRIRGGGEPFLEEVLATFSDERVSAGHGSAARSEVVDQAYLAECLLTRREREVLELLEQRLSNKEIAQQLFIAPSTVKRHCLSIYSKLGAGGRREAVAKARQLGLLPPPH